MLSTDIFDRNVLQRRAVSLSRCWACKHLRAAGKLLFDAVKSKNALFVVSVAVTAARYTRSSCSFRIMLETFTLNLWHVEDGRPAVLA